MQLEAHTPQAVPPQRRAERIELSLPVRVEVREDRNTGWEEIARFLTVSSLGAGFLMHRELEPGRLVLLTSPIPRTLRHFDHMDQQYRIWALVRFCQSRHDAFHIGVAFYGKNPPESFLENPTKIYDLVGFDGNGLIQIREDGHDSNHLDAPKNTVAKHSRYLIPVEVFLEKLDRSFKVVNYETTVSENLSLGGAAVFTSLDAKIGDMVRVNFMVFNVSILARVCNHRIGKDGMPRLHLEFVDRQLPLDGIE